ncbi:MAG TPA: ABC transporter permease subunit [Bryobacteraceae bacterium]|nr:ABC transporter permease subunit [Bryobacteraceae bacterium]
MRRVAIAFLIAVFLVVLPAEVVAPYSFATQFRDLPNAAPSHAHLLGTDALGRDRLSRLLFGARVSLLLAPAAALLSVLLALGLAFLAALGGSWWERAILAAADLSLSLPWFFLLLAARALLPLNAAAATAAAVTFGLLGVLGWAEPARVMVAAIRQQLRSDFVLLAHASGCGRGRIALVHLAPHLAPVAAAQFLIATPAYLLAEANLGLLGLGIPEPMPSWGNLLRELESVSAVAANPWVLAPAAILILVVGCFHLAVSADKRVI